MQTRCPWPSDNAQMIAYHDTEWGVPVHDDRQLFGKLVLDGFQAGLSWAIILRKRDAFLRAFEGFNPDKMARYDARRIAKILRDPVIVRNKQKVTARKTLRGLPAEAKESAAMSKALVERGFRFVGPTICYAFMQAVGMVNDHLVMCYRYAELTKERSISLFPNTAQISDPPSPFPPER